MPISSDNSIVKELVNRGMWIFPCELPSKKPFNGWLWTKHKLGYANVDEWLNTAPVFGTELAKMGLWCCDLDKVYDQHFKEAPEKYQKQAIGAVIKKLGKPLAKCRSGGKSGGWHLFYRLDKTDSDHGPGKFDLLDETGKIAFKGDIRAAHGYVIMWKPAAIAEALTAAAKAEPVRIKLITGQPDEIRVERLHSEINTDKITQVRSVLAELNLDDRQDWLECGMALHDFFDGADQGLDLWDEVSAAFNGYTENGCADAWKSFKHEKSKKLTFGTLVKRANDLRTAAGKSKIAITAITASTENQPHQPDEILTTSDTGIAKGLKAIGIEIFFNRRSGAEEVLILPEGKPIFGRSGFEVHTKRLDSRLRSELQRRFSVQRKNTKGELETAPFWVADNRWKTAIGSLQDQNQRDPFAEWLESTAPQWDKQHRLESIASNLWKTESPFAEWLGVYTFLLPVLRTYRPYKSDEIPILQGPQGCGKSYFFENILPDHLGSLFYGNLSFNQRISAKERLEKIIGKAIAVWSECAGTRFSELEQIKDFLTTIEDVHRFNYERTAVSIWRTAAIAATTNSTRPLPYDETGSRRFVVLQLEKHPGITDKEAEDFIAGNKLQWWAEAFQRAKNGDVPNLPNELKSYQTQLNPQFENRDIDRDQYIEELFLNLINEHEPGETKNAVSTVALLEKISPVDKDQPAPFRGLSSRAVAGVLENLSGTDETGHKWTVVRDNKKLECPVTGRRNYLFRRVFVHKGQPGQQSGQKKQPKKTPEFKHLPIVCPLVQVVQVGTNIIKNTKEEVKKGEKDKIKKFPATWTSGQVDKPDNSGQRKNGAAAAIVNEAIEEFEADDNPHQPHFWD